MLTRPQIQKYLRAAADHLEMYPQSFDFIDLDAPSKDTVRACTLNWPIVMALRDGIPKIEGHDGMQATDRQTAYLGFNYLTNFPEVDDECVYFCQSAEASVKALRHWASQP